MATIANVDGFPTTFDKAIDIDRIVAQVGQMAHAPNTVNVMFVGEDHKVPYDVQRRKGVYDGVAAMGVKRMIERGMDDRLEVPGSVVCETDHVAKSADDGRNVRIIQKLVSGGFPAGKEGLSRKPLVIFFGAHHEPRLKEEICRQFPADVRVNWTSIRSVEDYVAELPNRHPAMFDVFGRKPVGYVEHNPDAKDYKLALMAKGHIREGFFLELMTPKYVFSKSLFAIYFADRGLNDQIRAKVQRDDSVVVTNIVRFNGAHTVRAVHMLKTQVEEAEAGKYREAVAEVV